MQYELPENEQDELNQFESYLERKTYFMNTILLRIYDNNRGDSYNTYVCKLYQYEHYERELRKTTLTVKPHRERWNQGRKRKPTGLEIWLGL